MNTHFIIFKFKFTSSLVFTLTTNFNIHHIEVVF